jgi:hypothetical protein
VDELERMMRATNPSGLRRSMPLSLRAEVELAALLAEPAEPQPQPAPAEDRRWFRRFATALAAIAVTLVMATVIAITDLGPTAVLPSVAGPPLLQPTALDVEPSTVLTSLAIKAALMGSGPGSMTQVIRYEAWSIQVDVADRTTSFVQPEEVERHCGSDRSGYWEARAGAVRYGVATDEHPAAAPGDLLRRDDFATGEFPMAFPKAPPVEPGVLEDFLRTSWGLTAESSSVDYFTAIEGLRLEWQLSGAQTAAVLDLLATRTDIAVAGQVRDRLGRDGIAVEATAPDGTYRTTLVFSSETGMLLSSEQVYLGGIPDFDFDFPTVTNYYAWKDTR